MNKVQTLEHRRATPVQARSAATVEAILSASQALLIEEGLPGFNTNAVAKRAGVNVATLYHYFPNKTAILRELFERDEKSRVDFIVAQFVELGTTTDLNGWLRAMTIAMLRMRWRQPAGIALRRACRAVPELMEAEEAVNVGVAEQLSAALLQRSPHLTIARAGIAARAMVEVTTALLDFARDHPDSAYDMVEALESILRGYFGELAKPGPPAKLGRREPRI